MRKDTEGSIKDLIDALHSVREEAGRVYLSVVAKDSGYSGNEIPNTINALVGNINHYRNRLIDDVEGLLG